MPGIPLQLSGKARMNFKVVWYCHNSYFFGGGERLILEGQKQFTKLGIKCPVLMNAPTVVEEMARDNGYNPDIIYGTKQGAAPGKIPFLDGVLQYFRVISRIYREAPDILICNSPFESFIYSVFRIISFRKKIPFVCFQHGSYFQFPGDILKYTILHRKAFTTIWNKYEEYQQNIPLKRPAASIAEIILAEIKAGAFYVGANSAESMFVLSEGNKKVIEELFHHKRILVFHGAISEELLTGEKATEVSGAKNETTFFSLCRLVKKKRVDIILEAYSLYLKINPASRLVIGGTGEEKEALEKLASELGISGNVTFAGFIPDDEIDKYYRECDIFVSADLADYDITTITALAYRKKLVVPFQHEFNYEYGNVFQSGATPEDFCKAFEKAAGASIKIDERTYIDKLKEYTWEYYYTNIAEHLQTVIGDNGK